MPDTWHFHVIFQTHLLKFPNCHSKGFLFWVAVDIMMLLTVAFEVFASEGPENSTYVPDLAMYFSSLNTISVDYSLTKYFDDGLQSFYLWTTIWSVFGSVICIVLNFSLIIWIFTIEDFKNWVFFPVGLQAVIDIVGPGFSNIAYNVISFGLLQDGLEYDDYMLSGDFVELTFVDGKLGCTLTFFRSIMNEYTTGLCVLASAFFRYCLICHPTAKVSTPENFRRLSLVLVFAILIFLISNFWDMAVNGRQITDSLNTKSDEGMNKFISNCKFFIYRNNVHRPILARDIVIFFCVPASLSAFFYLRIFKVLRERERNENRNRNLIVAFALNWVLWIICWAIFYTTMSINLAYHVTNKLNSERTIIDVVKERLSSSKEIYCLFYSQFNAVFFLIVLKPFQKQFVSVMKLVFSSNELSYGVLESNNNVQKQGKKKPEKKLLKKKLRTLCVLFSLLVASLYVISETISVEVNTSLTDSKEVCFFNRIQTRMVQQRQVPRFLVWQDAFSAEFEDPRLKCGKLRGCFSMKNRRCYFSVKSIKEEGLNLTDQVELCSSQNGKLAYPLSFAEAGFLYRYYLFECGPECRTNVSFETSRWFIRLGFHKQIYENWSGYQTFDGNLVITFNENSYSGDNSSLSADLMGNNKSVIDEHSYEYGDRTELEYYNHSYYYEYDYEHAEEYNYDYGGEYDYEYEFDYDYEYAYVKG